MATLPPITFANEDEMKAAAFAPSVRLQPVAPVQATAPTLQTASGDAPDFLTNLDNQFKTLKAAAETDPSVLIQGIERISGSIAAKEADIVKEVTAQTYAKYNVPQLSKQLEMEKAADRRDPNYKRHMTDSAITNQAEKNLQNALALAHGSLSTELASNAALQSFKASTTAFKTMLVDVYQSNMNSEQKLKDSMALRKEKMTETYDSFSPETKGMISTITGVPVGDVVKTMSTLVIRHAGDKDMNALLEGGESEVPKLALLGNKYAKVLVAKREVDGLGIPLPVAKQQLSIVENVMNNPAEALRVYKLSNPTQDQLKVANSLLSPAAKIDKTNAAAAKEMQMTIASDLASRIATEIIDKDVTNLKNDRGIQIPPFLAEAKASTKYNNGPINKTDAITIANMAPTIPERQANLNQLEAYYGAAIDRQGKSYLFKPQPFQKEAFKAQAVMQGFGLFPFIAKSVKLSIDTVADSAQNLVNDLSITPGSGVDKFLFGAPDNRNNGGNQ